MPIKKTHDEDGVTVADLVRQRLDRHAIRCAAAIETVWMLGWDWLDPDCHQERCLRHNEGIPAAMRGFECRCDWKGMYGEGI